MDNSMDSLTALNLRSLSEELQESILVLLTENLSDHNRRILVGQIRSMLRSIEEKLP